jgi:vancomycin permeability regulator SanA
MTCIDYQKALLGCVNGHGFNRSDGKRDVEKGGILALIAWKKEVLRHKAWIMKTWRRASYSHESDQPFENCGLVLTEPQFKENDINQIVFYRVSKYRLRDWNSSSNLKR